MAAVSWPTFDSTALARLGVTQGTSADASYVLSLDWPDLEEALPDGGLPRGVVEIATPVTKKRGSELAVLGGGATTIALHAVRAAHARDDKAWCAWITPADAPPLYAPAAAQAGVDLERLLVVRPDAGALARTAVKVVTSGAFEIVVVDAHAGLDGKLSVGRGSAASRTTGDIVVRKLALAAEEKGTTSILLTNAYAPRALPWPVALRLETTRRADAIAIRVTKDRRGRSSAGAGAGACRVLRVEA